MSDPRKTKRPTLRTVRSTPKAHDARAESAPPPRDLEAELESLRSASAQDADDLAAMLVRVAALERARTAAEERSTELGTRVEALEGELARARTATLAAEERVRMQDENAAEIARLKDQQVEERRAASRLLENEKSTSGRARQQAAAAEARLRKAQAALASMMPLVDRLEAADRAAFDARTTILGEARSLVVTLERMEAERQAAAAPLAKATDRGESAMLDALDVDIRK